MLFKHRQVYWPALVILFSAVACAVPGDVLDSGSSESSDQLGESLKPDEVESLQEPGEVVGAGGDSSDEDAGSDEVPDDPQPEDPQQEDEAPQYTSANALMTELLDTLSSGPRDYAKLQSMMGEEFVVIDGDDTQRLVPEIAAGRLQGELLRSGNVFSYRYGIDVIVPDIIGYDPADRIPEADSFVYTQGWVDGNAEAVLIISEEGGGFVWQGIILDRDGF